MEMITTSRSFTVTSAPTVATNIFETTNRQLEQFLYAHDIFHSGWYKDEYGMTTWIYPDTVEVKHVVAEYREICKRRVARRAAERRAQKCAKYIQ